MLHREPETESERERAKERERNRERARESTIESARDSQRELQRERATESYREPDSKETSPGVRFRGLHWWAGRRSQKFDVTPRSSPRPGENPRGSRKIWFWFFKRSFQLVEFCVGPYNTVKNKEGKNEAILIGTFRAFSKEEFCVGTWVRNNMRWHLLIDLS